MTGHSPAPGRWRSLLAPGIAALAALAILLSLGSWQLDRKVWKEDLLAAIATRAYEPPGEIAPEAEWPRWDANADEFRRVKIEGTFLHVKEALVQGLTEERRGQPLLGFFVFTPLRRDDGSVVIVNRGFVPPPFRDPATRPEALPTGRVAVVGLVRNPEKRGWFVPANEPDRDRWFVRSIAEMAQAKHLDRVAPFYVDADATPNPGGWPRGGQTRVNLPNNHLGYAITWFGLAATLVGVFGAFAWRRLAGADSGDQLKTQDAGDDQPDASEPQRGRRIAE